MECDKHLDRVKDYNGSLDELARDVGNMRYDAVVDF